MDFLPFFPKDIALRNTGIEELAISVSVSTSSLQRYFAFEAALSFFCLLPEKKFVGFDTPNSKLYFFLSLVPRKLLLVSFVSSKKK